MANLVVSVTADSGGPGQSVSFTNPTCIGLSILNKGNEAIQFTLNGTTWSAIAAGSLPAPVSYADSSTFRLRKTTSTSASVQVELSFEPLNVAAGNIIVGAAVPSNADGMPDGTVYIQA